MIFIHYVNDKNDTLLLRIVFCSFFEEMHILFFNLSWLFSLTELAYFIPTRLFHKQF